MEKSQRKSNNNEVSGNTPHRHPLTPVELFEPWHSTPVKKTEDGAQFGFSSVPASVSVAANEVERKGVLSPKDNHPCLSRSVGPGEQKQLGEMENHTIQRQRRELQLLMAELKDRDQELNTMAAAHQNQLQAWEQDRRKVLTLEQKCARLEGELEKRSKVIRASVQRVHAVEAQEKEGQKELSSLREQLHELSLKQQDSAALCQDLQESNQSMNATLLMLSSQVGQMQVREEELNAMLKLRDRDVTEATDHIVELSHRLRELEVALKDSKRRLGRALRDAEESKHHLREASHENAQLKDELQEKIVEAGSHREEIIRLKQEEQLLQRELAFSGEGESWKDDLLQLARSKQERTQSELDCLRQVCVNQQNDLQLLQLNLASVREELSEVESQRSHGSQGDLAAHLLDGSSHSRITRRSSEPISAPPCCSPAFLAIEDHPGPSQLLILQDYPSPTDRLQHLLAESRQMVLCLERSSLRSDTPSPSPKSNSVLSLCKIPSNESTDDTSQDSAHICGESLLKREDPVQPRDSQPCKSLDESGVQASSSYTMLPEPQGPERDSNRSY